MIVVKLAITAVVILVLVFVYFKFIKKDSFEIINEFKVQDFLEKDIQSNIVENRKRITAKQDGVRAVYPCTL